MSNCWYKIKPFNKKHTGGGEMYCGRYQDVALISKHHKSLPEALADAVRLLKDYEGVDVFLRRAEFKLATVRDDYTYELPNLREVLGAAKRARHYNHKAGSVFYRLLAFVDQRLERLTSAMRKFQRAA